MKPVRGIALCAIVLATVSACGGGGGGGSVIKNESPAEVPFTSFSAVGSNQTVVMSGVSQEGSGTATAFKLEPTPNDSNSTVKLTYDRAGNLSGTSMSTPKSSLLFGKDDITPRIDADSKRTMSYRAFDGRSVADVVDPAFFGWNYQSFGVWMTNVGASPFQAGAISAGLVTPASAVPTIGSATFKGHAGGFYFDGAGRRFSTDAQMSAVANFQNRSIDFSTSGTVLKDLSDQQNPLLSRPELNLRGSNLSYASGSSRFSGTVTTPSGLSGNATGRFYGPSAQEIGGVYGLTSTTDGSRMIGGFGGKR